MRLYRSDIKTELPDPVVIYVQRVFHILKNERLKGHVCVSQVYKHVFDFGYEMAFNALICLHGVQAFSKRVHNRKIIYFSTKTYVVGTQKNRLILDETVLLSTQNICLNTWVRKYLQFKMKIFVI